MEPDQVVQQNLLFDFYGKLLTGRQQEVLKLYYEENFSLGEIAEEFTITRQGVHDTLKHAEKSLQEYEAKLGLMKKFQESRKAIDKIGRIIEQINDQINEQIMDREITSSARERSPSGNSQSDNTRNKALSDLLQQIKTMIDQLQ